MSRLNWREDGLQVPGRIAERPVVLERELEEVVAQEDDLLGPREHAEVRREPELERVLLDEPVAEGVEGGDLHVGVAVGHERVHALFHLGRRLVGEGQREDLGRAGRAGGDQVGDAAGDDGGLAGARARDDEQRAGLVGDGRRLGRVQAFEDPLGAPRWPPAIGRPQRRISVLSVAISSSSSAGSRRARRPRSCT